MLDMEVGMTGALWAGAGFLAGALVGGGIIILLRRGRDAEQRIRRLQRDYDLYQADVARHFTQTGELLSRLRGAFEQLYGEVEDRATELVGEDALQRRLRDLETGHGADDGNAHPPTVGDDRSGAPGFGGGGGEPHVETGGEAPTSATTDRAADEDVLSNVTDRRSRD